ncbi:hypothetical protein INR49_012176 [Caranx melampygus]|nr:hypothetical protein INR49_012176 [Caranx melampygus]
MFASDEAVAPPVGPLEVHLEPGHPCSIQRVSGSPSAGLGRCEAYLQQSDFVPRADHIAGVDAQGDLLDGLQIVIKLGQQAGQHRRGAEEDFGLSESQQSISPLAEIITCSDATCGVGCVLIQPPTKHRAGGRFEGLTVQTPPIYEVAVGGAGVCTYKSSQVSSQTDTNEHEETNRPNRPSSLQGSILPPSTKTTRTEVKRQTERRSSDGRVEGLTEQGDSGCASGCVACGEQGLMGDDLIQELCGEGADHNGRAAGDGGQRLKVSEL